MERNEKERGGGGGEGMRREKEEEKIIPMPVDHKAAISNHQHAIVDVVLDMGLTTYTLHLSRVKKNQIQIFF